MATLHSRLTFKIKDENTSPSLEVEVKRVQVNSALAMKDFVADTIGTVLSLLKGPQFLPYIELCVLKPLPPSIRRGYPKECDRGILEIIKSFYDLSDPQDWQPRLAIAIPLHHKSVTSTRTRWCYCMICMRLRTTSE